MTRDAFFNTIKTAAEDAGVFERARVHGDLLECEASGSAEPAAYRVSFEGGSIWVSLVTENRWLSESIEADLMHTGDKLEELLEEELADLGYEGPTPAFEHFRSEKMLFTFRTAVPGGDEPLDESKAETTVQVLLGYEACFRELGDMSEDEG
ncbi:MAG: hypothetical protein K8E66_00735 [Phycisphaerales bacterium]|nr:hypothetical protein [Phycisphaerales bacterium]